MHWDTLFSDAWKYVYAGHFWQLTGVTPECGVQNAHETMNEPNHSNDSHHRREIVMQSILNDSYHSLRSSRTHCFAAPDTVTGVQE
jgi:hypothetical protein